MTATHAPRATEGSPTDDRRPAHTIRVPAFLLAREIGLGQVVKQITTSIGVPHCAPCAARAARLDRWLHFAPEGRERHPGD